MVPLSGCLERVITQKLLSESRTAGRRIGNGRKEGGRVESRRERGKEMVGRRRNKSRMERKERKEKTKGRWLAAACQRSRLHAVLHGENGRKCSPPQLAPPPPPAPISGSFSLNSSHTLLCFPRVPDSTAGPIKTERGRETEKRRGRKERSHNWKTSVETVLALLVFSVHIPFYDRVSHKHARGAPGSNT